jgi:hypothetical protein
MDKLFKWKSKIIQCLILSQVLKTRLTVVMRIIFFHVVINKTSKNNTYLLVSQIVIVMEQIMNHIYLPRTY